MVDIINEEKQKQTREELLSYFPGGILALKKMLGKENEKLLNNLPELIEHICIDPRFAKLLLEWRNALKSLGYHHRTGEVANLIGSLTLKSIEVKHIALVPNIETINTVKNEMFFSKTLPALIEESFAKHQISIFSFAYFDSIMNLSGSKQDILLALDQMIKSVDELEKIAIKYQINIFRVGSIDIKHADTEVSNKLNDFYTRLITSESHTRQFHQYRLNLAVNFNSVDLNFSARYTPLGSMSYFKRVPTKQFEQAAPDLLIQCATERELSTGHHLFDSAKCIVPLKDSAYEFSSDHLYTSANRFTQETGLSMRARL